MWGMIFKGSMAVVLGVGGLVAIGCGDGDESRAEPVADGGEPSKPDQTDGGKDSNPNEAESGGGGAGGEGGEPTKTSPLPSPEEIAAEIESIAGTSFVVHNSSSDVGDCGSYDEGEVPAFMAATLSFVKNEDGELELFSSVAEPWLRVERSVLSRTAEGWVAAEPVPLGGCMAHVFEEEVADVWLTPDTLRLNFSGADSLEQPTMVTVNAHFPETSSEYYSRDAVVLVEKGQRDAVVPRLWHAPEYEHWDLDSGGKSEDWVPVLEEPFTPRVFQFTELLEPGWKVEIEDPSGERWPLAEDPESDEPTTAITLDRYFPVGSRFIVDGRDLAGNALTAASIYTAELSTLDGAFEADGQVWTLPTWYAYELQELTDSCELSSPPTCRATALPGHPSVAAIEGTSSALLSASRTLMRVARADAASLLRFRVRALAEQLKWQSLTVELSSLDTGASLERSTHTFDNWLADTTIVEDSPEKVSELREIEVPLPAGDGDVLVVLDSPNPLWLDALRTE